MSYTPRSLFRLIEDMDAGRLLLPHIQRAFVWEQEQMARLFDSLMRDYPIQTLLFWRTKEAIRGRRFMQLVDREADLSTLYDVAKSAEGVEKTFVLDGQQRLQTLHAIFRGGVVNDEGDSAEAYFDVAGGASTSDGDLLYSLSFEANPGTLPLFRVRDMSERYASDNPLSIADEVNDQLEKVLDEDPIVRKARERRVRGNLQQLYSILHHDKHFWVDELDGVARSYPYRRILEIFVRVNTGGTKLTQGELMFAAMKEGWDDIEERVEQTVDLLNGGRLSVDRDFVLKCFLLAEGEGAEISTEKFWGQAGERLLHRMEADWDKAEIAFQSLRDFMVHQLHLHSDRVIRSYNALIPLFDYLFHNPKPTEADRVRMVAYFHKAQLFGWYGSQTDAVLNGLHSVVGSVQPRGFPLAAIKLYFSTRRLQTELGHHVLSDARLRPLLLNIVYSSTWGASPFDVAFKGNEPHVDHIYPQSMLRTKLGYGTASINDIGNLRFFGATDNIRKRAELPGTYFKRLKSHGVPIERHLLVPSFAADPENELTFSKEAFDRFRETRRSAVWSILKSIVDPEAPDPTAP